MGDATETPTIARDDILVVYEAVVALGGNWGTLAKIAGVLGECEAHGGITPESVLELSETGFNAWRYLADGEGVRVIELIRSFERKVGKGEFGMGAERAIRHILDGLRRDFGGQANGEPDA